MCKLGIRNVLRGGNSALLLSVVCFLACNYAPLVLAVDDGAWVHVGEAYFPAVSGDFNSPVGWGNVSLLNPAYAVGPDGVGVVSASAVSGTVRYVFAMRCDRGALCGWVPCPSATGKWTITTRADDAFGATIPTLIQRCQAFPLLTVSGEPLGGIVSDAAFGDFAHAEAVGQFIRAQGIPSVSVAAHGRSMWFVKWVSDGLAGRGPANPPWTSTSLPLTARDTAGFTGSIDYDGDNVLNITQIVFEESPLGASPFVPLDVTQASGTYALTTQLSGANGDTTVYNTASLSAPVLAGWTGSRPQWFSWFPRGDVYRIAYTDSVDGALSLPGIGADYVDGRLGGASLVSGADTSGTMRVHCYFPGGASFFSKNYKRPSGTVSAAIQPTLTKRYYSLIDTTETTVQLALDSGSLGKIQTFGFPNLFLNNNAALQTRNATAAPVGLHCLQVLMSSLSSFDDQTTNYELMWLSVLPAGTVRAGDGSIHFAFPANLGVPAVDSAIADVHTPKTFTITCAGADTFDVFPRDPSMSVNHSTGVVTWADPPHTGNFNFKVWGHSGYQSVQEDWVVNVGNATFAITSVPAVTLAQGGSFHLLSNVTGTVWTHGTLPAGFTLSGDVITVAGSVSPGTYTVPVTATNGGTHQDQNITFTIIAPPTVTNPTNTTISVTNPDGSTTTTTSITQPNGSLTTTTTTIPNGGGTPVTTQTTTGGTGIDNGDVVDAIDGLPGKLLGDGQPKYGLPTGDSIVNESSVQLSSIKQFTVPFLAPAITAAPLEFNLKMPTRWTGSFTVEGTAPVDIPVSTAPPSVVAPYLPVVRVLFLLMFVFGLYQSSIRLWRNL